MAVTKENLNDDKGPKILAVLWTLTAVATLFVVARIFIRLRMLKNFGVDDYLIIVSVVMALAYCGVTTADVIVGFGKHATALSEANLELAILLNTVSFLFGILSFTIPKLAVTAMLNRILNPGWMQKTFLWLLTGSAAIVSCICIIILFTMCDPPAALWHVHLLAEGAKCKNVWILIDYAIFTGCALPSPSTSFSIYIFQKLTAGCHSIICFCRSLPGPISTDGAPETAHVTAEETCSLRSSRSWIYVSLLHDPFDQHT